MSINRELSDDELEAYFGGAIKAEDLPDKFKPIEKDPDELDMGQLENVYGGPIKAEDLPENFYTENSENIMGR